MTDIIKHIRKSANMSQNELAEELRVAFATVNRWENGKTVPPPAAQKAMYDFCVRNKIDVADFVINALLSKKRVLEESAPGTKILFHGSKSGLEGSIMPISRAQCDFGKGFYMG